MDDINPVFAEEEEFEYQYKSMLKAHLGNSDCHEYYARNKIHSFPITWFTPSWKLSIATMIQKIKPAVTQKNEFEY